MGQQYANENIDLMVLCTIHFEFIIGLVGLEGPGPIPPRRGPHHPGAEDRLWRKEARGLHHAERGPGEPVREGVCLQLGGGVLHDGLDLDLLGSRYAVGDVRG